MYFLAIEFAAFRIKVEIPNFYGFIICTKKISLFLKYLPTINKGLEIELVML
jgi:hypothetical protein